VFGWRAKDAPIPHVIEEYDDWQVAAARLVDAWGVGLNAEAVVGDGAVVRLWIWPCGNSAWTGCHQDRRLPSRPGGGAVGVLVVVVSLGSWGQGAVVIPGRYFFRLYRAEAISIGDWLTS
jgi:hypothetical protein